MLTAGTAVCVDLRRDISDQARTQAAPEALTAQMNAKDVVNAMLSARFGAVEELMREVCNYLRENWGRVACGE
jgi:hypothetical protein